MDAPRVIEGQMLYGSVQRNIANSSNGTNAVAVWTPAAGKAIRLENYIYEVPGSCTVAGAAAQLLVTIGTPSLTITVHAFRILTTVLGNGLWASFERNFPGGILLPRGEALSMTLSTAVNAGTIAMHAFGREE